MELLYLNGEICFNQMYKNKQKNKFKFNEQKKSSRKYYYYRRPIGDPTETYRRPIGDLSETHRRPIGDPSETDMPHRRPIGDRHVVSKVVSK